MTPNKSPLVMEFEEARDEMNMKHVCKTWLIFGAGNSSFSDGANWGALNSPVVKMLEEALTKIGNLSATLTNGKAEYKGDGYGYVLKQSKDALNQLAELRRACGGSENE